MTEDEIDALADRITHGLGIPNFKGSIAFTIRTFVKDLKAAREQARWHRMVHAPEPERESKIQIEPVPPGKREVPEGWEAAGSFCGIPVVESADVPPDERWLVPDYDGLARWIRMMRRKHNPTWPQRDSGDETRAP